MGFTNKEVAAKYKLLNADNANVKKATPKGTRFLKDITPAIAAFLVKTQDPDIELLEEPTLVENVTDASADTKPGKTVKKTETATNA